METPTPRRVGDSQGCAAAGLRTASNTLWLRSLRAWPCYICSGLWCRCTITTPLLCRPAPLLASLALQCAPSSATCPRKLPLRTTRPGASLGSRCVATEGRTCQAGPGHTGVCTALMLSAAEQSASHLPGGLAASQLPMRPRLDPVPLHRCPAVRHCEEHPSGAEGPGHRRAQAGGGHDPR